MPLTLAEQLLLVATHDEKGSLLMEGTTAVPYGLAGARLIELHLRKRIAWLERRLVALLGLVHGCGLISEVVPKGERRQARKEVKKLLQSENIGMAVAAVVREINTAVIVAVIAASSTGSSATSSIAGASIVR
jgi:hypothetical protein